MLGKSNGKRMTPCETLPSKENSGELNRRPCQNIRQCIPLFGYLGFVAMHVISNHQKVWAVVGCADILKPPHNSGVKFVAPLTGGSNIDPEQTSGQCYLISEYRRDKCGAEETGYTHCRSPTYSRVQFGISVDTESLMRYLYLG